VLWIGKKSRTYEKMKEIIHRQEDKIIFYICLGAAMGLLIFSAITPPPAIIDGSILTAVAELLGFAALGIVGKNLAMGKEVTVHHGETEVTIGEEDEEK
jgi:hypothetical protein